MALLRGHRTNFARAAARNSDLVLMECQDATTGEYRAVTREAPTRLLHHPAAVRLRTS